MIYLLAFNFKVSNYKVLLWVVNMLTQSVYHRKLYIKINIHINNYSQNIITENLNMNNLLINLAAKLWWLMWWPNEISNKMINLLAISLHCVYVDSFSQSFSLINIHIKIIQQLISLRISLGLKIWLLVLPKITLIIDFFDVTCSYDNWLLLLCFALCCAIPTANSISHYKQHMLFLVQIAQIIISKWNHSLFHCLDIGCPKLNQIEKTYFKQNYFKKKKN